MSEGKGGGVAVPASSITNPVKTGYLTKLGARVKNWKKRWFVLKGDTLFYYKTPQDRDKTGVIQLEATSVCKLDHEHKKRKNCLFSISTKQRVYVMYSETAAIAQEWVDAIANAIAEKRQGTPANVAISDSPASPTTTAASQSPTTPTPATNNTTISVEPSEKSKTTESIRDTLRNIKKSISYLADGDKESKVSEFWDIWYDYLPPLPASSEADVLEFTLVASSDTHKLSWRVEASQHAITAQMIDFFFNVGAPSREISLLRDVGNKMNPPKVGCWIDVSSLGAMDGGWHFPIPCPISEAIGAADPCQSVIQLREFVKKHSITQSCLLGRDVGAAPPQQTEIRFVVPGVNYSAQIAVCLDALTTFNIPHPPAAALEIMNDIAPSGLVLSVVTCTDGIVRCSILFPYIPASTIPKLCGAVNTNSTNITALESILGKHKLEWVEFQYLNQNFGYNVYKEGFDIHFVYRLGVN